MRNALLPLVLLLSASGCEMSILDAVTAPPPVESQVPVDCRVLRVVDGDTFTCRPVGSVFTTETVRLLAIDAPEQSQALGAHATAWLRGVLPEGAVVVLRYDREVRDRYDRLLAWVEAGDLEVNHAMVWEGMAAALVISPNTKYATTVRIAEGAARLADRGLWALGLAECLPTDFRADRCGA